MEERSPIDRISSLPDEIIHKILYRLDAAKQAARTSALSRRWLHLWRTYPVVEFHGEEFDFSYRSYRKIADLLAALSSRLSLYYENNKTPLESFRLSLLTMTKHTRGEDLAVVLRSALDRADYGSPLEVVIRTERAQILPKGSFSNFSRTKVLELVGCCLDGLGEVSLQGLQALHLVNVTLREQWLYDFVGNAPNLDSLSLQMCSGIGRLEVSARDFPTLKTLDIRTGESDSGLELQLTTAPFLESLVFHGSGQPCKLRAESLCSAPNLKFVRIVSSREWTEVDLDGFITQLPFLSNLEILRIVLGFDSRMELRLSSSPCLNSLKVIDIRGRCNLNIESPSAAPNLRVLKLGVPLGFTQSQLDGLVSNLPSLESLYLEINHDGSSSRGMTKMRVSPHRRLRVLELHDYYGAEALEELEIDAPNLVRARYSGSGFRFPEKINVLHVPSDCQFIVEGHCDHIAETRLTHESFLGLRHSLSALSRFHLVLLLRGLDLSQEVSFDLSRAESTSSPLIIQYLRIEISLRRWTKVRYGATFLDGLFWACRPKLVSVSECYDGIPVLPELIQEQLQNKDIANCCYGSKCWRHQLRNVKMETVMHSKVWFEFTWC
ncbi:unnamed protein product [Linum trigynum]|uniref:F-box domain-containing protein n=1 Tax=Linum trigynum TaxID=586398 RepID=A0AAV2D609_9ROSI